MGASSSAGYCRDAPLVVYEDIACHGAAAALASEAAPHSALKVSDVFDRELSASTEAGTGSFSVSDLASAEDDAFVLADTEECGVGKRRRSCLKTPEVFRESRRATINTDCVETIMVPVLYVATCGVVEGQEAVGSMPRAREGDRDICKARKGGQKRVSSPPKRSSRGWRSPAVPGLVPWTAGAFGHGDSFGDRSHWASDHLSSPSESRPPPSPGSLQSSSLGRLLLAAAS